MASFHSAIFKSKEICPHLCSQVSYRKFALKIALLLLIIISFWSRHLINYTGQSRASKCHCQPKSSYHLFRNRPNQTRQTRILIISEARSGSSFLGDLLQQVTSTYYSFEPLIGIDPNSQLYDKLIFELFNCNFNELTKSYLRPIYWKVQYFKWNSLLLDMIDSRDKMQMFNQTVHRLLCLNGEAILVKTIRFTLHDYWREKHLYGNGQLAIKVIYLVRDPRAVMNSRYRMAWCQHTENCTSSEVLCQRMRANIDILRQINNSPLAHNVALIRHEDLIMDMLNSTKQLLEFLHMSVLDKNLVEWIHSHTSVDDLFSNPHSTYRDIKALASQWKTDLSPDELMEIEENCLDVMSQLGYKPLEEHKSNQTGQITPANEYLSSIDSEYPLQAVSVRQIS